MKTLLTAIKTALQQASLTNFKDNNIFITPDELLFPSEKSFPEIALKDSTINHTQVNQSIFSIYQVRVIVYNEILKEDDSSIMGDTSRNRQGLFDIAAGIRGILDDNLLDLAYVRKAFCASESESLLISDRSRSAMRKILTYNYEKRT